MSVVFENVLMLALFAAVGYTLCKTGLVDSRHSKLLSTLEVYIFLPCLNLRTFANNFTVQYFREKHFLLLSSLAILAAVVLMAFLFSRLLAKKGYLRTVYSYSLTIPNYGYMGYALAETYGDLMLQNTSFFGLPLTLYVYTVGFSTLTKAGKLSLKKLLNPVMIAILLGMVLGLSGLKLPAFVDGLLGKAAACMSPVSMILAGMVISEFDLRKLLKKPSNYGVVFLRLLVIPCIIAGALKLLGLTEVILPALLIYAMPCGMNTIVFPRLVGEDCEPGAALAFISSILACLTIPLCFGLFA